MIAAGWAETQLRVPGSGGRTRCRLSSSLPFYWPSSSAVVNPARCGLTGMNTGNPFRGAIHSGTQPHHSCECLWTTSTVWTQRWNIDFMPARFELVIVRNPLDDPRRRSMWYHLFWPMNCIAINYVAHSSPCRPSIVFHLFTVGREGGYEHVLPRYGL